MKIAFLLSRIEQSGVTTHTLDLTKGLVDMGHEVCLITGGKVPDATQRVDDFYTEFMDLGVLIKEFKTPEGFILAKGYQTLMSILQMIRDLKNFNPDIIHCQSPYTSFVPWLMGEKFAITIHNTKIKKNIKFKNPTRLIAISEESKEIGKNVFGIDEQKISIVHHGVSDRYALPLSENEKESFRQKNNIPSNKILIGFVGRPTWEKGCDVLANALANLEDTTKDKMHCVFLGGTKDSKDFIWLQNLIGQVGITKYVSLIPYQDPKPFYDIFDIFVLPSRMESFPLVTLEAMMAECCPVRSNTEGCYEQIDHGSTGLLFENEDVGQLTSALQKLINDPELIKNLGKNAKQKALSQFTIPNMTKNTLEVYDRIRIH